MSSTLSPKRLFRRRSTGILQKWLESEGAQIVELAVTLPLLTAMFVGTYDFGQAFNLRQKLIAATREGARFAANQTTADLNSATATTPASIIAIRNVIDSYLQAAKVTECRLPATAGPPTDWSWTFTTTGCSGGNFTLTINRGFPLGQVVVGSGPVTVEGTQVRMSYPYQWQFNRVVQLLVPGSTYAPATQIQISAVVQNLN